MGRPVVIQNCCLIIRDGEAFAINQKGIDETGLKPIIKYDVDGVSSVDLNGYLIAPIELFSKRQIHEIGKRNIKLRDQKAGEK